MRKHLKRTLVLLLAASILSSAIPVWAMDEQKVDGASDEVVQDTIREEENTEEFVENNMEGNNDENNAEQDKTAPLLSDENVTPETTIEENNIENGTETEVSEEIVENEGVNGLNESENDTDVKLNYIYVESPYLETPGTENIALSLGDGTEEISNVKLLCFRDDGESFELESTLNVDELYLFTREFCDEAETGSYWVESVTYTQNEVEKQIQLSEVDAVAEFGVNQEYEGYAEESNASAMAVSETGITAEPFVAVLNDDGTADVEDSIAMALESVAGEISNETGTAAYSARVSKPGIVVALDPGHDVGDAGAYYNGLREEVLTLEIAQYCKQELETYAGVEVYMTRTSNACPYGMPGGSGHAGPCIRNRVRDAANAGADIFVSLHLNASVASSAQGAEIIIPNMSWKPEQYETGKALAEKILAELSALGLSNRGYYFKNSTDGEKYDDGKIADYFTVQNAGKEYGVPGIIVEHAFISNVGGTDQSLLSTSTGRKKLGVADAKGIAKYLGLVKGQWVQVGDKWKFRLQNGTYITNQFFMIGGDTYYFDLNGYRLTGWQKLNGKQYYFTPDGVMITGWNWFGSRKYYFTPDGEMVTGWVWFGSRKYFFGTDGVMRTGWCEIDGNTYYFTPDGVMITGWNWFGSKKYYFTPDGIMWTGWAWFGSNRYYFDSNGVMVTGEKEIDGENYVFDENGILQSGTTQNKEGWVTEEEKKYYYEQGKKVTGWKEIDGKTYYLNPSLNGAVQTGWTWFGSRKYYFSDDGVMSTSWQKIDSKTYFFNENGEMVTGWVWFGQRKHYFMLDGSMLTGWAWFGQNKYYFDSDGVMAIGKKKIDGKTYVFDGNGVLQSELPQEKEGWVTEDGKKYYYESGKKVTGWKVVDGSTYYFNPSVNGAAQIGWVYFGSRKYYFASNGVMSTSWQEIDGKTYFFYESGEMLTGWVWFGQNKYYFTPDGYMLTGWAWFGQNKYYFKSDGKAAKGWLEIDGRWCYFDDNFVYDADAKYEEEEPLPEASYEIAGTTSVAENTLVNWFNKNAKYPEFYKKTDAPTVRDFCRIYMEEAKAEGIKAEVAFAQAMKETGWLRFGGAVKPEQFNFAGIGAIGGNVGGATFKDVREGVRAQIQHLKAYANKEALKNACVDPRFHLVTRGTAKYVEWLGIKENPNGFGWAASEKYGYQIVDMIKEMKKY